MNGEWYPVYYIYVFVSDRWAVLLTVLCVYILESRFFYFYKFVYNFLTLFETTKSDMIEAPAKQLHVYKNKSTKYTVIVL